MRFGVLGPLTIEAERPIIVGGPQLRRVLAALVAHADHVVTVDQLAELAFEDGPSDAAPTTLRSYVARLRRAIGDDGTGVAIVTVHAGYRLELGASDVDAHVFEAAVDVGRREMRDGNATAVAEGLHAALTLWRGSAYSEFALEEWAHAEAIRLDELRVEADEMRLSALVEAGEHDRALADLARFVEDHPYRSEGWASLVLALYRSGRQAEALRCVARHRRLLAEIGLEPTPELLTLESRIADHDPAIRQPAPASRRLRGYHLVEEIGRGRHGVVHGSVQPGVDRDVALRQFGPEIADLPGFIRTFDGLVQRVARLEHPYIVPILDFWREPGMACLVTRRFRGGSLTSLFDKGPAGAEVVAGMIEQVASALHAAHRSGLGHGVLSSGDVLFDDDGNAFVDGIGIDAALDHLLDIAPAATYTPPGPEGPDTADQYALAALAYHALTGFPPVAGSSPGRTFPHVSEARPELLALDGVLARAGARSPDDRYADISIFARSLTLAVGRTHQLVPAAQVPVPNPYRGLRAFGEADAPVFFGRDDVIDRLLDALERRPSPIITLIGASGSGKSSMVHAGLIPRLRAGAIEGSEDWYVATMVPGKDPFAAFADSLTRVAMSPIGPAEVRRAGIATVVRRHVPHGTDVLVVVDQLEELFTVTDAGVRTQFIGQLTDAATDESTPLRVVATMRADYYDRPLAHHVIGGLVSRGALPVVAMSPAEFEQAIVEPAAALGVEVDGRVVAEIVAACANRPGALPLLQFCMTELFSRRTSNTVTFEDYRRLGGITGAIAERAESIFEALDEAGRRTTRRVFLRLVTVGETHDDLRRRVLRSELTAVGEAPGIERLLEQFGEARLLTFDRDPATREQTVEVAHESLLGSWPRLRDWIRDEGQGLQIRSDLTRAAHAWDTGGRDSGDLARGARLVVAEMFVAEHGDDLTTLERDYVATSVSIRDQNLADERERAARQRSSNRRLRQALVGIAIVLVVATAAGAIALVQRDRARAQTVEAERSRGRALAVTAIEALGADRSLSLLLSLEAGALDDSIVSRRALLASLGGGSAFSRTVIPTPADDYSALDVAVDGSLAVAKRGDGAIDVVDLTTRAVRWAGLPSPPRLEQGLDLHPEGSMVASAGVPVGDVGVMVYDVTTGELLAELPGAADELHDARFSPDGTRLAVSHSDGRILVYDVDDWSLASTLEIGDRSLTITALEFTPDGEMIVAAATPLNDGTPTGSTRLSALDADTGEVVIGPIETDDGVVSTIVIPADAGVVVAAVSPSIRLYSLDALDPIGGPIGESESGGYGSIAVSPDGMLVGVTAVDFDVFAPSGPDEWTPVDIPELPSATGVAFVDGGSVLITADADGAISTIDPGWVDDLGVPLEPAGPGLVTLDPTGEVLAVWARSRGVQFFDRATLEHLGELPIGPDRSFVGFAFDPSAEHAVTLTCPFDEEPSCGATLTVWDLATKQAVAGPVDAGDVWFGLFDGAAFTGDGAFVVTAGYRGGVRLWDSATLEPVDANLSLADVAPFPGTEVRALATGSRDGRSLLVATGELNEAVVWDLTDGVVEPIGPIAGNISNVGILRDGRIVTAQGGGTFQRRDPFTLEPVGAPFITDIPTFHFQQSAVGTLISSSPWGAQLWDIASSEPISGPLATLWAELSPDGSTVYLGAYGEGALTGATEVRAVSLVEADLAEEACERAGRNLTLDEWDLYMPAEDPYRPTCPQWPDPTQ